MKIYLTFTETIPEGYRQRLRTYMDQILAQGLTKNRPPCFYFEGINSETCNKIIELSRVYDVQHGL